MTEELVAPNSLLYSSEPIPAQAQTFTDRLQELMSVQPKDDSTATKTMEGMDEIVGLIAAGLYTLASMLAGEGEESVRLVEMAIANAEVSACCDPVQARQSSRRALCAAALELLERQNPGCLVAPEGLNLTATCIEDDDLDAAGVSREELESMIDGPYRDRVRRWLAGLPVATRAIFGMRAVARFTASETAAILTSHGGPAAAGWTVDAVRAVFRQGLCSLASQLIQASVAR